MNENRRFGEKRRKHSVRLKVGHRGSDVAAETATSTKKKTSSVAAHSRLRRAGTSGKKVIKKSIFCDYTIRQTWNIVHETASGRGEKVHYGETIDRLDVEE